MKKFFLFFLFLFVPPFLVFAQANITISSSVPGMGVLTANAQPGVYISGFYNFALMIGGVLVFGAIVYGGILYAVSAGNSSKQSEGKEVIKSALVGLLLLAGAYLILYTINPNLVNLSLPTLSAINIEAPTAINGIGVGNTTCTPATSGPCSIGSLTSSCMSNDTAASEVCNTESNGNANAQGDKGDDGYYASIGLFQINLSANTITDPSTGKTLNCPSAFSNPYTGSNPHTHVVNQQLYQQCLAAAENPSTNIQKACSLSKSGTTWSLWGPRTRQACGV